MNEHTKALIKNAAVLGARALRRYKLARDHEALAALNQALATTAEAIEWLERDIKEREALHETASEDKQHLEKEHLRRRDNDRL